MTLKAQVPQKLHDRKGNLQYLGIACHAEGEVLDGRRCSANNRGHWRRHHDVPQRRQQHAVSVNDGRRAASADRGMLAELHLQMQPQRRSVGG